MHDFNKQKVIKIALVILTVSFILITFKGIYEQFNVGEFIHNKTTEILIFLAIGVMLRLYLNPSLTKEDWCFLADAIVVASTIGLMLEVQHIRGEHDRIKLEGEWMYEVTNNTGLIQHGGISTIKQMNGNSLVIEGFRKYICSKKDEKCNPNKKLVLVNDIRWSTQKHFAIIHGNETKTIYFVYTIYTEDGESSAYCYLTPNRDNNPDELTGDYVSLASTKIQGNVFFKRKSKDEAIQEITQKVKNSNNFSLQVTP